MAQLDGGTLPYPSSTIVSPQILNVHGRHPPCTSGTGWLWRPQTVLRMMGHQCSVCACLYSCPCVAIPGGGSQDGDAALQTRRPVVVLLKSQAGLGLAHRTESNDYPWFSLAQHQGRPPTASSCRQILSVSLGSHHIPPIPGSSPPLTGELCFPECPLLVCMEGSAQPQGDRQSRRPHWHRPYLLDFRQGGTTKFEVYRFLRYSSRFIYFLSGRNNCEVYIIAK